MTIKLFCLPTNVAIMLISAALFLAAAPAHAVIKTWDGGAGTFSRHDGNNWNPDGVPNVNDDVVIDLANASHSLGLRTDGSIATWGSNSNGQLNVPAPNSGFIAIAAGRQRSLAIRSDGSAVGWGANFVQNSNPFPFDANMNFVAIAEAAVSFGVNNTLGLKSDGSITMNVSPSTVPVPNSNFVAIAPASTHNLGLKSDGSIVAWGSNMYGQLNVSSPNANYV